MTRFEVYDPKFEASWGVFDEYIEAEALAEELNRRDPTREVTVYAVDTNEA